MRQAHKDVFFAAADRFQCWIGLREPNPLSEKWIGLAGYMPKPESCKAKSADNPGHRFAGLVVDPTPAGCPDAFQSRTRDEAVKAWNEKFLVAGQLPAGYTRDESGLVKLRGLAIYADFDLMALVRSNDRGEFLFTSTAEQKALFDAVEPVLNRGLGARMIQHGAEFMWEKGVGARESESVYWFGPGRRFRMGQSSMPRGGH